jgi:hypothetical protein
MIWESSTDNDVEIAVKPWLNEQDIDFFAQGINKLGNICRA